MANLELVKNELMAYKRKSEIDDLLRKFGDKLYITLSQIVETGAYFKVVIMPETLFERYEELGLFNSEYEVYQIEVDIHKDYDKEKLVEQVETMLKAYENSLFTIATKQEGLYTDMFYNEGTDEYYYIIENTVIIFNSDLQQIVNVTLDDVQYDDNEV